MAFLVLVLCIKAVIPAGFMVTASADTVVTVSICADTSGGFRQMQLAIPAKEQAGHNGDSAKQGGHCAFTGLAKVAVGGADAVLLAMAFAFLLVLGLGTTQSLPSRQFPYLRPPLRGPPATA